MNKRGDLAINLVIVAILGLVVLGIYFIIAGNTKGTFESGISQLIPNAMEIQTKRCADVKISTPNDDVDSDGLSDLCDLCISKIIDDSDSDSMPDSCDRNPAPDTSPITACCGKGKNTCPDIIRTGRNFQCSPK